MAPHPPDARKTIGGIAHQRQVVWNRLRRDAELLPDPLGVTHLAGAAVELHYAVPVHHLREILDGRADQDLPDTRVGGRPLRRGGQGVVRLVLHGFPDDDAKRLERLLERMELAEEGRIDALAGLVAGPQVIPERLDDVIGGNPDVRRALLEQRDRRAEDTANRTHLVAVSVQG